jgi:hypothetical protein
VATGTVAGQQVSSNAVHVDWTQALPPLDFTSVTCNESATLKGDDKHGAVRECSLDNSFTVPNVYIDCTEDIITGVLDPIAKAANSERILKILETTKTAIDVGTAETNFQRVVALLGLTPLPIACSTDLADIITGGQEHYLELCLSNTVCTDGLIKELNPIKPVH